MKNVRGRNSISALSLSTLFILVSSVAGAQPASTPASPDAAAQLSPDKLPSGVIASQGNFQKVSAVQDVSSSVPSDAPNPIIARVTRAGNEECVARITNSSKDSSYSVNIDIVGLNPNGTEAMKKNIIASIGPEKTVERKMFCRKGLNVQVVMRSGTKR